MTNDERPFYLEMAKYHQDAMQSRRAIQLKILTGTVVVFLLLAEGTRHFTGLSSDQYKDFTYLMRIISVGIVFLFIIAMAQIEAVSKSDRNKSDSIETALWSATELSELKDEKLRTDSWLRWLWRNFAFTVPVLAVIGLAAGLWSVVEILRPT